MLPLTEFYQIAGRRKSTLCKTHHKEYYKSLRKKGSKDDPLDD